jgi:hypothetical protein
VFLQYLLGLRRLGWDILFVDRLEPALCTDRQGQRCLPEHAVSFRYFVDVMARFGFGESFSVEVGQHFLGLSRSDVIGRVRRSALLLNIMGYCKDEAILAAASRRVFLDIDPGFGQMWCELKLHDLFRGHDAFVTIGESIGRADCEIPTCGLKWITTPQPIVLEAWPFQKAPGQGVTSIISWRGAFGPLEYQGKTYGLRVHEFRNFATLPRRRPGRYELALNIHGADQRDVELLEGNGWSLVDPRTVAGDPWSYRAYVQQSQAEFMVAKNMYVQTRSGWFSDRSLCYLASGRPVLAQDTGWTERYPCGEGLLAFRTLDEAAAGIEQITENYQRHTQAARAIAEEYFDSDKVLGRLLTKLGVA